ncbi:stress protein [Streptomyces somaliensis]|uniref:stress protein n=1 Tax=Streptomyces somaliensis TaxID=78355 RepID=UPI0020CC9FBA|nr:stress protein [Streptomyces somaliensis]MCP9944802.1 stress protein [Streptomyces somaliensis]MCP9974792.1 stress protein [Streptomyces somaliensis]
MRRTTTLTALALTTAVLTGAAALPAQAAERPAVPAAASSTAPAAPEGGPEAAGKSVTVNVSMDQLGRGRAIADALRSIDTDDRGAFVQKAVDKAFEAAGGWHNVMLFNLSQNYDDRFQGTRLYANVKWGNIHYGLWVFESGEFTNKGDGGWINWGFRGWYERNGGHVKFNRSW